MVSIIFLAGFFLRCSTHDIAGITVSYHNRYFVCLCVRACMCVCGCGEAVCIRAETDSNFYHEQNPSGYPTNNDIFNCYSFSHEHE